MCGFIGQVSDNLIDFDLVNKANDHIICRGPDQTKQLSNQNYETINFDNEFNVFQVFNRLSILDLSETASQPMISEEYRTSILFNGEIYNHKELRTYLEDLGIKFKSNHSDTEVALLGLSKFGVSFIEKLKGQFSIVFFNYKNNEIYLIRDRLGQKPLFYSLEDNSLLFSSNLKALLNISEKKIIKESSLNEYLSLGVVTSPNTLFEDIYKVKPSEVIVIDVGKKISIKYKNFYWDLKDYKNNNDFNSNKFYQFLTDSLNKRLNADVPVANLVSGGIDSTLLLKLTSDQESNPNTYSSIQDNEKYNEEVWINEVLNVYRTSHTSNKIKNKIGHEEIIESIDIFDEPYADPSTFPSYLIYKSISKEFKVAITGDGGDELSNGYNRVNYLLKKKTYHKYLKLLYKIYPKYLGSGNFFLRNDKNIKNAYNSYFHDLNFLKILKIKNFQPKNLLVSETGDNYKDIFLSEYLFYLNECMHLKVDRTSMASSVEARSPYVDSDLVEYMYSLNQKHLDIKNPKKVFKDILNSDFSDEFYNRKKMGFVFNLEDWVFKNFNLILKELEDGEISNHVDLRKIKYLNLWKSRINGLRVWKLYFLNQYLQSIKFL